MASATHAAALAALLLLGAASLPATAADDPAAGPWVGATTGDDMRLRAGPSLDFRVLERLPRGTWLVVTAVDGDFARVRVPGGVPVFVHADLVDAAPDGKSAVVAREDVLLRATPGQEYFPVEGQRLRKGDPLLVLGRENGEKGQWLRVLPPERIEVYASVRLLARRGSEAEKGAELARLATERREALAAGRSLEKFRTLQQRLEAESLGLAAPKPLVAPAGAPAGKPAATDGSLQERVDAILRAGPAEKAPRFQATGVIRRNPDGTFSLGKAGGHFQRIDSLRYDLDEWVGRRVGIRGRDMKADGAVGAPVLRVAALELLE